MAVNLTVNSIPQICDGHDEGFKPVVQIVDLRSVGSDKTTADRFRMVVSDGVHGQQAMLATQMNDFVKNGTLQKGSIIQLNEFICNTIQNRKIIIILNMEVVLTDCEVVGNPRPYVSTNPSAPEQGSGPSTPGSGPPMSVQSSSMPQQRPLMMENPQVGAGSYNNPRPPSGPNINRGPPMNVTPEPGFRQSGSESLARGYNNSPSPNMVGYNQNSMRPQTNTFRPPMGQQSYNQPPPMYVNRGPIAKNEAPTRIIPIAALNPYQGRWTIKARVTAKGDLRRYNNPRGEGKVFSFDLLDSEGGEIRITCFNAVADQFYDRLEVGKVYLVSKGSLKPAQRNFNHLNNEWEIFLESTSTIEPCMEEDPSIPRQQFNFRPINEIEHMESNSMVDLIGIVSSINPSATIMRKNGTETQKRTLQLKDMSGRGVEVTLWGNFCNNEGQHLQDMCDSGVFPVLAVKAGRVNDFSGKSVGTISTSQLFINPDFPEAQQLREWFDRDGKSMPFPSISRDSYNTSRADSRKTVAQIKDEGLGRSEKPDWITVKAIISFIKVDNFCYTACPLMVGDRQCNKKVNNNGDGTWHCDRCEQTFPECDYRYLLQAQIQDHTGLTWVTAFQESGEELMGISAKDLYFLKYEEQDDVKFADILRNVVFNEYMFKLKVKEEIYSDEQRVKSTIVKVEKLNFSSECKYLVEMLEKEKLSAGGPPGVSGVGTSMGSIHSGGSGYSLGTNIAGQNVKIENGNGVQYVKRESSSGGQLANMGYNSGSNSMNSNNMGFNSGAASMNSNMGFNSGTASMNSNMGFNNGNASMSSNNMGFNGGNASLNCYKCGGVGHNSVNCPRNRLSNSEQSFGGSSDQCFKCKQSGHWAKDCPGVGGGSYGNTGSMGGYGMRVNSYGGGH
ncbi:replication protein A 70 kDa DNA-binding subunit A [Amborella trichopoda]|nr:replication protein A 70 kDa DNA-binding subunit A [Amborella trichopoda]|eukprot:XP_006854186.2 replication protein A 70 kDa DNA-binding subunit A [Amborella trichopoda]